MEEENNLENNLGRMKLNKNKTKIIVVRNKNTNSLDLEIKGYKLRTLNIFKYLNSKID